MNLRSFARDADGNSHAHHADFQRILGKVNQ